MKSEFFQKLAKLLDKYDAKLVAESTFDEFQTPSVAVVFKNETEDLGGWVSGKELKKYFTLEESNCNS